MLLFCCNLRNFKTMEKCHNPYLPVVVFSFLYVYICMSVHIYTYMVIDVMCIMGIWYVCICKTFGRCPGTY